VPGGKSLEAVFTNPQGVVNRMRQNARNHKKVYTVNSN